LLALATAAFVSVTTTSKPKNQSAQRSIGKLPTERNQPISIRGVKVHGTAVRPNKEFVAGDDWLTGLTVEMKNRSPKAVLFAAIQLQFPRAAGFPGPIAVDELFYGNYELTTRIPNSEERGHRLAPGDTAELSLTPDQLEGIAIFLLGTVMGRVQRGWSCELAESFSTMTPCGIMEPCLAAWRVHLKHG
jgi:hypothetical protein